MRAAAPMHASSLELREDAVEFAAMFDFWSALDPDAREHAGLLAAEVGGCRVIGSRHTPELPMLNRVMGAEARDAEDGALGEAVALLHDAGCVAQVAVRDTPSGRAVRAWLEDRGFAEGYAWMKFVHGGSGLPRRDVPEAQVLVRPCVASDAEAFGAVLAAGYDLPPALAPAGAAVVGRAGWHCLVVESAGGETVGVGALYVDGDTGWLGLGATLPEARGLGAQNARLRASLDLARSLGCSLVVTETGERVDHRPSASYRNILRAGFVEHGLRRHVVSARF